MQDLLFNLKSLTEWIKSYWYWVLAGFAGLSKNTTVYIMCVVQMCVIHFVALSLSCSVILIVLLQVTYRRRKLKKKTGVTQGDSTDGGRPVRGRGMSRRSQGYGFYQRRVDEVSPLIERTSQT